MAAVKMKNKLKKDCVRKHCLNACRKSNKTNTRLASHIRSLEQAATSNSLIHNHSDVSSIGDGSSLYTESNNDSHDTNLGASADIFSSLSPLSDSAPLAFQSDDCAHIGATLFSPNPDQTDWRFKPLNQWQTDHYKTLDEQTELPHLVPDDSDDGSCGTTDSQICHASDFCVSESGDVSSEGEMGFSDIVITDCPGYGCMVPDLMFDMTEYLILPFLENNSLNNAISTDEAFLNLDTNVFFPIHLKPPDHYSVINFHSLDEEAECFDPQLFFRSLPDFSESSPSLCPVVLTKEMRKTERATLVLDLDETLVHSTLEHCEDADFTFPVLFNMKQHTVYVKRRPHLQAFLDRVAEMFDVVIFTASQSIYAEQLLDTLDPGKKLISQRIYRESCIFVDGIYTKDLTILGVDLAKVVIIDNSPQVFRFQVSNGIPIKSWFDDPSDSALVQLLPFLESLADADDVRPIIARKFVDNQSQD